MKKELEYFAIEGAFGGNQDWFSNVVMNMGGCAAATACDSCIYFAKYMGMRALYPYDINNLTKEDYKRFSQVMKPYIRPRVGGVRKLSWYVDGFSKYIAAVQAKLDIEEAGFLNIRMQEISGDVEYAEAYRRIKSQIDAGLPVPYLMLTGSWLSVMKRRMKICSSVLRHMARKFGCRSGRCGPPAMRKKAG